MSSHNAIIQDLCGSGAQSKFFWKAIRAIATEEGWLRDDLRLAKREFQPDAFVVDRETKVITLFEVEHHHLLNDRKLTMLAHFWWDLDCEGWCVELVRVNNRGEWTESNLMAEWYRMLAPNAAKG